MKFNFNRRNLVLVLLLGVGFLSACVFFTVRLDYVIHHDLYSYGLQFSEEWAVQAWTYKDLTFAFAGCAMVANFIGLLYLSTAKPFPISQGGVKSWRREFSGARLISLVLLIIGSLMLTLSFIYISSTAALVGLGLTFWGALFLYIKPTKYVKLELLNAASSSTLVNIERILANSETNLKGIYLPPNRLADYTSSLIFIPAKPNQSLPKAKETNPQQLQSKNPKGLFITPPGLALSKLLEKELKKPFTETSLRDLQRQLPKLLEELQITKNTTIQNEGNLVIIEMKNHVFENLCEETRKLKRTHETVGCPLSSALACVLAKATGKPVTIEKEETLPDKTTQIQYTVLED